MGYHSGSLWGEYVPVAQRKAKAQKHVQSLKKKGQTLNPIILEGKTIAKSFWGKAWCENLESYSDYKNRLPRGRTYLRNGSVIDLQITKGKINAQVMGSYIYDIEILIKPMNQEKWKSLVKLCSGKIDSLIELLQGKFSKAIMEIITEKNLGLFPNPYEIGLDCSCPDWADMCKHVAAVLYGVGTLLDSSPELLFVLRHVNHLDLISSVGSEKDLFDAKSKDNLLKDSELSSLFGIEIDSEKSSNKKIRIEKSNEKPKKKKIAITKKRVKRRLTRIKEKLKPLTKSNLKNRKK